MVLSEKTLAAEKATTIAMLTTETITAVTPETAASPLPETKTTIILTPVKAATTKPHVIETAATANFLSTTASKKQRLF